MSNVIVHTDPDVIDMLKSLTRSVTTLQTQMQQVMAAKGERLNCEEFARYLGVHRHTLRRRLDTDHTRPRPGKDGKWLLQEVIEWQSRQS